MTLTERAYDLGIAWNWEYDDEFVNLVEQRFSKEGFSTYRVETHNLEESYRGLKQGLLSFRYFLDRASDADEKFEPLARLIEGSDARFINRHSKAVRAMDKATMHLEFLTKGLQVPYTIVISPYSSRKEVELSLSELAMLGRPFIIKPANTTGGGSGVVTGAESLQDVLVHRQHHKNDKYLLQERVQSLFLDGRKAWFRVISIFGEIQPCWWDNETHRYQVVNPEEWERFRLHPLSPIMRSIEEVCQLDFFSSEIAFVADGRFVVVDYVNHPCDMRLQSRHWDGVPDDVVHRIVGRMVELVKSGRNFPTTETDGGWSGRNSADSGETPQSS